ncbi:MAG: hypothetical protein RBT66_00725 [bacterium]|jgi:hypothetical protein|nr:hypothetical protein [bacterium]
MKPAHLHLKLTGKYAADLLETWHRCMCGKWNHVNFIVEENSEEWKAGQRCSHCENHLNKIRRAKNFVEI